MNFHLCYFYSQCISLPLPSVSQRMMIVDRKFSLCNRDCHEGCFECSTDESVPGISWVIQGNQVVFGLTEQKTWEKRTWWMQRPRKRIFYMKISQEFTFTKSKEQYDMLRCETVGIWTRTDLYTQTSRRWDMHHFFLKLSLHVCINIK